MSVSTKARLFFFTPEARAVFSRQALRLEDSLSFETVNKYLSLRDAAKLVALGRIVEMMPGFTGIGVGSDFLDHWKLSAKEEDKGKISTIELLAKDNSVLIEIRESLLNPARRTEQGIEEPFKIELFSAHAIGITFAAGSLADLQSRPSECCKLLRKIVKAMCIYEPYGAVMATPLGLRYIESL